MKFSLSIFCLVVLWTGTLADYPQMCYKGQCFPQFTCPKLPAAPPSDNVRQLRPGNIKAIMAVGDSITAGFGMHSGRFWDVLDLVEYRGDVYSMGGNPDQYTLPNYLKNYNPDLVGASIGKSLPLDALEWQHHIIQPFDAKVTHLNAAQSEAKIKAVPAQLDYLVSQLNSTYKDVVDFHRDWKMLTIWIGANNICPACNGGSESQPDYYEEQLRNIINQVYQTIPRVFVNVLPMFNISQVYTFAMTSDYCKFMWDTVAHSECGCITDNSTPAKRLAMDLTSMAFNERIYKVVNEWEAKNLTEFLVRVQPVTENMKILGLEFMSELDCFHPTALSDAAISVGLWNNILTPPNEKVHGITPENVAFKCPTADTYLQ